MTDQDDPYKQNKEAQQKQYEEALAKKREQVLKARQQKEAEEQKQSKPHADPFNVDSLTANIQTKQGGMAPPRIPGTAGKSGGRQL
jgi:hypothetical protein